jgi:hypothetical protein
MPSGKCFPPLLSNRYGNYRRFNKKWRVDLVLLTKSPLFVKWCRHCKCFPHVLSSIYGRYCSLFRMLIKYLCEYLTNCKFHIIMWTWVFYFQKYEFTICRFKTTNHRLQVEEGHGKEFMFRKRIGRRESKHL